MLVCFEFGLVLRLSVFCLGLDCALLLFCGVGILCLDCCLLLGGFGFGCVGLFVDLFNLVGFVLGWLCLWFVSIWD